MIVFFPPSFPVGCESSEYCLVLINADHLSAVRKWTTEESVERMRREEEGKKREKAREEEAI